MELIEVQKFDGMLVATSYREPESKRVQPLYTPPPAGEARGEWLPIESAPRDGTRVLLSRSGGRTDVGLWEPYQEGHWIDDGEGFRYHDVDGWMPLPLSRTGGKGAG
jgi:hypothetical protein